MLESKLHVRRKITNGELVSDMQPDATIQYYFSSYCYILLKLVETHCKPVESSPHLYAIIDHLSLETQSSTSLV
jgi:hypothetical protein